MKLIAEHHAVGLRLRLRRLVQPIGYVHHGQFLRQGVASHGEPRPVQGQAVLIRQGNRCRFHAVDGPNGRKQRRFGGLARFQQQILPTGQAQRHIGRLAAAAGAGQYLPAALRGQPGNRQVALHLENRVAGLVVAHIPDMDPQTVFHTADMHRQAGGDRQRPGVQKGERSGKTGVPQIFVQHVPAVLHQLGARPIGRVFLGAVRDAVDIRQPAALLGEGLQQFHSAGAVVIAVRHKHPVVGAVPQPDATVLHSGEAAH